jgi:hypothetical protein
MLAVFDFIEPFILNLKIFFKFIFCSFTFVLPKIIIVKFYDWYSLNEAIFYFFFKLIAVFS